MNNWIPVSERLPETGTCILIHSELGGVAEGEYDGSNFIQYRWSVRNKTDVTHWQPLPPAPDSEPKESKPEQPIDRRYTVYGPAKSNAPVFQKPEAYTQNQLSEAGNNLLEDLKDVVGSKNVPQPSGLNEEQPRLTADQFIWKWATLLRIPIYPKILDAMRLDLQCISNVEVEQKHKEVSELMSEDGIHEWFELTYAQYLTIPRSVLQSMPKEWQHRFVKLLEILDETIDWRPKQGRYWVQLRDDLGKYTHDSLMDYDRGRRIIKTNK